MGLSKDFMDEIVPKLYARFFINYYYGIHSFEDQKPGICQCEKGKTSMGYNAKQIFVDDYDGGSSMTNDIQTAIRNGSTQFQMETKLLGESLKKALGLDISPNPIQKVIFNAPATIVFWKDGSKTVVKAQGDEYDPEKGLAMAISRHYLCDVCGLERYDGVFNRYLPKDKN